MTRKDKQLLLCDLCARLPYGVKIAVNDGSEYWTLKGMFENEHTGLTLILEQRFPSKNVYPNTSNFPLSICKPYLRPMESMTEREKVKYLDLLTEYHFSDSYDDYVIYDWLNKKMFDFRGLIKKDLAIEVTEENNPYKD